jgi:uncharacterized protein YggE
MWLGAAAIGIAALVGAFAIGRGSSRPAAATTSLVAQVGAASAATSTGGALPAGAGISVSGDGQVTGTPDTMKLDMGVDVQGATVEAALDGANKSAAAVQASLKEHGVADRDLQTSGMSIQPDYAETGGRTTITGYRVTETLSAQLHDLKKAGAAISAAAQAGGNATRIQNVSLNLTDTPALVGAARDRAFAQAKAKAEQYAKAAGVQLGGVLSIQESTSGTNPTPFAMDAARSSEKSVPIAAGTQTVTVSVSVVFAIG